MNSIYLVIMSSLQTRTSDGGRKHFVRKFAKRLAKTWAFTVAKIIVKSALQTRTRCEAMPHSCASAVGLITL